jgi:hypothetical protein
MTNDTTTYTVKGRNHDHMGFDGFNVRNESDYTYTFVTRERAEHTARLMCDCGFRTVTINGDLFTK